MRGTVLLEVCAEMSTKLSELGIYGIKFSFKTGKNSISEVGEMAMLTKMAVG